MRLLFKKILILCCALIAPFAVRGIVSSDLAWEFDATTDPDGQGVLFTQFDKIDPRPADGVVSLTAEKPDPKQPPELANASYYKSFIDPEKFDGFEIRLKTASSGKLRLHWHRSKEKAGSVTLELAPSGEFRNYRFPLKGAPGWAGKEKFVAVRLAFLPDKPGEPMTVEIDRIAFLPSDAARFEEKHGVVRRQVDALAFLESGLAKHGIVIPAAERIRKLKEQVAALDPSEVSDFAQTPVRLLALEPEYAALYALLSGGRRLFMLRESAAALRASCKTDDKPLPAGLAELEREWDDAAVELKSGKTVDASRFDGFDNRLEQLWNSFLAADPATLQEGVSRSSYGRYGWGNVMTSLAFGGDGCNSITREAYYVTERGGTLMLKFAPEGVTLDPTSRRVTEATYTSASWEYDGVGADRKQYRWAFRNSLLAPGFLLETNVPSVRFTIDAAGSGAPGALLVPTRSGIRRIAAADLKQLPPLSENWILLLAERGITESPYLLTLEKIPDSFLIKDGALLLGNRRGVGRIGVATPWGTGAIRPNTLSDRELTEQARAIAGIMNAYPDGCEEFFSIDRSKNAVEIRQRIHHLPLRNAWNTPGRKVAPVPPLLAFAVENGYPARLPQNAVDRKFPTLYGPYLAVEGDNLSYRLPLPDLRNPTPVRNLAAYPQYRDEANKATRSHHHKSEFADINRATLDGQNWVYPAWSLLDGESRNVLAENVRLGFGRYFRSVDHLAGFGNDEIRSMERCEPFSGLPYLTWGWTVVRNGNEMYGDITNFSGFKLYHLYLHAKYTGDWKFLLDNYQYLRRIFENCPRRADWAAMGQSCMEDYFLHTIDMGPDSWCAPVAMAKIADAAGDLRLADLSLYLAAKQAVPLVAAFHKRKLDSRHNTRWGKQPGEQMPEVGWNGNGYVGGNWTRAMFDYNFILGILYAPEVLALYRDFCRDAAVDFEYGLLEKYYPQWRNPRFLKHGKNAPDPAARHLLLRAALDDTTENLAAIKRDVTLEGSGEPLGTYLSLGGLAWMHCVANAVLIGRDAPHTPVSWGKAGLDKAEFDPATGVTSLAFSAKEPFALELLSGNAPDEIAIDGKSLPREKWTFDAKRHSLLLPVETTGNVTVTLTDRNWKPPVRTEPRPSADFDRHRPRGMERPEGEPELWQAAGLIALDLKPFANVSLPGLAAGPLRVRGIEFSPLPGRAVRVAGKTPKLPLNAACRTVYLLAAVPAGTPENTILGKCIIRYRDGGTEEFPLVNAHPQPGIPGYVFPACRWINRQHDAIAVQDADIQQRPLKKVDALEIIPTPGVLGWFLVAAGMEM